MPRVTHDMPMAAALVAEGLDWIVPAWPAPSRVHALSTTRNGPNGNAIDFAQAGPHAASTRELLRRIVPDEPAWLRQVHGAAIADLDAARDGSTADGSMTRTPGTVCAVVTADCLPILLADRGGSVVAAAHAGWRGLAAGVIEATVAAMRIDPSSVLAWLGPAIGPRAFEVGGDVFAAFCDPDPGAAECFVQSTKTSTKMNTPMRTKPGAIANENMKWHADLYALARRKLARAGVSAVYGGGRCTMTESECFHSYRRDGPTANGRMATMIWLGSR
jgi:purine-nucleoside/S-methyl-5'-thioadenosine phosphorylase / adenosine deaminase